MMTVLVVCGAVLGGGPKAGLEATLQKGLLHYAQGDWKQAMKILRSVAPRIVEPNRRAVAFLHLGLAQFELKQHRPAEDSLVLALSADPLIDVDPVEHPPQATALFRRVRERLATSLQVTVGGGAARVFVDGVDRGASPLVLKTPIGKRTIRAESVDGRSFASEISVVLRVGQAAVVQLTLTPREVGKTAPSSSSAAPRVESTRPRSFAVGPALPPAAIQPVAPWRIELAPHVAKPRPRLTRSWGWVLAATSAVSLAVGGVLVVGATAPGNDSRASFNADISTYNARVGAGTGLILFGGVAGVGAVVLFLLHRESPGR